MDKFGIAISEIHLYRNKMESLIKVLIWIVSWIGGIAAILGSENKAALGNAYFIYMLSLLMEFAPKISNMKQLWSKVLHTGFCFVMAVVCLMAAGIIFGAEMSDFGYGAMSVLTIIILAYMVLDSFLLWIGIGNDLTGFSDHGDDTDSENRIIKFSGHLSKGGLGYIGKGAGEDE